MNEGKERKPSIRLPENTLKIIVIVSVIMGWGMTYATLRSDIKHLKSDVTKIETKYDAIEATKLEWIETVHKIEVHLERIDTRQQAIEKKLGL